MNLETRHRILKLVHENPSMTQRELSKHLGLSLGQVNYCMKAVVDKGWIKVRNFKNSQNKLAYTYLLTPSGIEEKIRITLEFYKRKKEEYEELKREVEEMGVDPEHEKVVKKTSAY
ncbi:MAG: MarR family EPS-associated transcriptional regulator [Leptospiraceae bacterium]|nr:MarR family EPS-associated transcriptional regulator [Leptospiraceae bacterium]